MKRFVWLLLIPALSQAVEDPAGRHLKEGMKLLEKGRSKDALRELEVAQTLAPERPDIQEALKRAKNGENAAAPLPTVLPTPLTNSEARARVRAALKEAREAYRDSSVSAASTAWTRALQLDANCQEAKDGLALLADEAYKKDADAPFDSSVADLYDAALREARKERLLEARKKLDEALSLNPSQAQLKSLMARIESGAYAQGAARRADEALREGERALAAGEWATARQAYDEALSLRPDDKAAKSGLSRLKEKSRAPIDELLAKADKASDDASAISYYKRVLEIDPAHERALEASARRVARQRKQMNAAARKVETDALYNQGVEAWQAGQLGLASEKFKAVLEIAPDDAEASKALESVRSKLSGQIDKDRAAARELMKEGAELEKKGKLKDAMAAYKRASAKDGSYQEAAEAVARLKKETNEN